MFRKGDRTLLGLTYHRFEALREQIEELKILMHSDIEELGEKIDEHFDIYKDNAEEATDNLVGIDPEAEINPALVELFQRPHPNDNPSMPDSEHEGFKTQTDVTDAVIKATKARPYSIKIDIPQKGQSPEMVDFRGTIYYRIIEPDQLGLRPHVIIGGERYNLVRE